MARHVITVPDVGEGIAEVELVAWSVAVGDTVTRNQVLAEVMTDKANVEIPSPTAGAISALHGEVGAVLAVGTPLIELSLDGEAPTPAAPPVAAPAPAPAPTPATTRAPAPGPTPAPAPALRPSVPLRPEGERPRASPAVRHRARTAGIDLRRVAGTGPAGRITHDDLDTFRRGGAAVAVGGNAGPRAPDTSSAETPIVGVRRLISERMVAATTTIPHITYVEEVDVTALEELRADLNAAGPGDRHPTELPRLTLLPFLMRALVLAIDAFPTLNAHVDDARGVLTTFGGVHVGIATQTPNGLVVPVVRHAEAADLWALAAAIDDLAAAARSGKATPAELSGSTITITSLGALGGIVTTPVINKPEVAIIGVNKIATRPVWRDGAFVPRKIMNLSSSFDHRVIDGWEAASFVSAIRRTLEQPARLFLDPPTIGTTT